jgi:hypothetical protein
MIPRSTIIATLVVVEAAIIGMGVMAVRGIRPVPWYARPGYATAASGPNLAEGGAHRVFDAGANPVLTVDIGYADLTIRTGSASQFDVSVQPSTDFGPMRAKAPITAVQDGATVHVATAHPEGFSMGDDRMVTVIVPPHAEVDVLNAGDIKAYGLQGRATIKSVGNGSVTLEDVSAPSVVVASRSGDISLIRVTTEHLDVTTHDGDIAGSGLAIKDGNVDSGDGRVTLGFASGTDTLVTALTGDGKIRVSGVPPEATAGTTSDDDSATRTVRIGAGAGRLDVHSGDGNIDIAKED